MSLTTTDFQEIRTIVREEVESIVEAKLNPLRNELQALRNDIKEIYNRLVKLESPVFTNKEFNKLPLEKRLLTLNSDLLAMAKEIGLSLPRNTN